MVNVIETQDYQLIAGLNEEIQNLHHQLHPEIFKPYDGNLVVEAFKNFFAIAGCKPYLAIKDSVPVGYAIFYIKEPVENAFHYGSRSLYIDQIGVTKRYRRSGVAALLMAKAEELALEYSIKTIELDHWSSNTVAASYFRQKGYSIARERLWKHVG